MGMQDIRSAHPGFANEVTNVLRLSFEELVYEDQLSVQFEG